MKRSLAILLAALACGAAAAAPHGAFSVTIAARDMHEQCVHLAKGEKRNYSWHADAPVDFNIHYHRGGEASYPIQREGMRGDGGTFVADADDDYCWMWSARERPVKLEGRIAK